MVAGLIMSEIEAGCKSKERREPSKKIPGLGSFWHHRKVQQRRVVIAFAACVLIGVGVIAFWPWGREPEYQGKKLSEWLALQRERPEEVSNAVRAIGTNGLPYLVKRVEYQIPLWRLRLSRVHSRLPGWMQSRWLENRIFPGDLVNRSGEALYGFRVLGTNAFTAIPGLGQFIDAEPANLQGGRGNAALAIAYIGGPKALPPLLKVLTDNGMPEDRRMLAMVAANRLNYHGRELASALPLFIGYLSSTNEYLASLSASGLGRFEP
jgi:hypothetical protein